MTKTLFISEKQDETVEQKNREIIRRQIEKWTSGDLAAIAEDFVLETRNHGEPVKPRGVLEFRCFGFSDCFGGC